MSTEMTLPIVGSAKAKLTAQHPLGPLTAAEISESSRLLRSVWPGNTNLQFKAITLLEPPKAELLPYLDAEHKGKPVPTLARKSFVVYYIRNTVRSRDLRSIYMACNILTGGHCRINSTRQSLTCPLARWKATFD